MRASFLAFVLAAVAAVAVGAACKKSDPSGAPPPTPAPTTPPTTASAPPPIPPAVPGPLGELLDAYDQARVKLAADDSVGAHAVAEKMVTSSRAAATSATGPAQQALNDLATAAEKMKSTQERDMPNLRLAFGEVSKAAVALLVADPKLQTGRFLFMCPMAKGYQKWVQTDPKLRNPYWGAEMLECGEELKQWSV